MRRPELAPPRTALRPLVAHINAFAQRMLQRRHVREKRQLPITPESQDWVCLEADALCVTPSLKRAWPGRTAAWLSLDAQPVPEGLAVTRRWLSLEGGGQALLIRRSAIEHSGSVWSRFFGTKPGSSEKRQANLLFRLQRHGVLAPRVLAMGEKNSQGGRVESFVLTEPIEDIVRLDTWLHHLRAGNLVAAARRRWDLIRDVAELLHRLHEAGCYLNGSDVAEALAVHVLPSGETSVVVGTGEGIFA